MPGWGQGEAARARELLWGAAEGGASVPVEPRPARCRLLRQAGMPRHRAAVLAGAAGAVSLLACLAAYGHSPAWLAAAPLAWLAAYWRLRRAAWRRAEAFERDYVPMLLSLAAAVRTGLDPLVALQQCAALFPLDSEMRRQVQALQDRLEQGADEGRALREFARDVAHPDLPLFRSALLLARRQGSPLAGSLRRLARVTRQRQSFRRKMRGALAMQRLSAIGIAGCAVIIGLIQAAANMTALAEAYADPTGRRALTLGVSLIGFGLLWMLYLSRRRV